jgi:hypothetical protein
MVEGGSIMSFPSWKRVRFRWVISLLGKNITGHILAGKSRDQRYKDTA